jgi:hypothetical protein
MHMALLMMFQSMDYVLWFEAENAALRERSAVDNNELVTNLRRQVLVLTQLCESEHRQFVDADVARDAVLLRCDDLERQLTTADEFAESLANSVLSLERKKRKYKRRSLCLIKSAGMLVAKWNTQETLLKTREKALIEAHVGISCWLR